MASAAAADQLPPKTSLARPVTVAGTRTSPASSVPFAEDFNPASYAEANSKLWIACTAAGGGAAAPSRNAAQGAEVVALGGFSSGGSSPYTNTTAGRAALPMGLCYWAPGNYASRGLGGRCAVPCIQYLGFEEAWWRNASLSGGFCPCHSQVRVGKRARARLGDRLCSCGVS
jgi:hypothetical protein